MDIVSKFSLCVTSNTMKNKRTQLVEHQLQHINILESKARDEEDFAGAERALWLIKQGSEGACHNSVVPPNSSTCFSVPCSVPCSGPYAITATTTAYTCARSMTSELITTQSNSYICGNNNTFDTPGDTPPLLPEKHLVSELVQMTFPCIDSFSFQLMPVYSTCNTDVTKKYLENVVKREPIKQHFELLSDNLDWQKKTNKMRKDAQNVSYHWFLVLGREPRVLAPSLSNVPKTCTKKDIVNIDFIPTDAELCELEKNYIHHISHMLTTDLDILKPFNSCLPPHIVHKHMQEMGNKSPYTIIDLFDKSENKSNDMIDVLNSLKKFASSYSKWDSEQERMSKHVLIHKVLDGDALTNERAINAQLAMANGRDSFECLQSFVSRPGGLHRMFTFVMVSLVI